MKHSLLRYLPSTIYQPGSRPSAEEGEDAVALISAQEHSDEPNQPGSFEAARSKHFSKGSGRVVAASTLAALLALWGLVFVLTALSPVDRSSLLATQSSSTQQVDKYLYLILQTPKPDVSTCKTVLSAALLNYPMPRLVQWNETVGHADSVSHRTQAKFNGTLEILEHFWATDYDNDTAVILGAEVSTWFQLRPEVFFSRFDEIQARANERLSAGLEQKILFAAKEECPRYMKDATACVDGSAGWVAQEQLDPRLIIGSVGSLKELYRHAVKRAAHSDGGELAILDAIFREQEQARSALRRKEESKDANQAEFGIGLDLGGELSHLVPPSADNASWIQYGSQFQSHPGLGDVRPESLDDQIAQSMPPYWTVGGMDKAQDKRWWDVQLFTSTQIPSVPALIQFNQAAESKSSQDRRQSWWPNLWMVPHGRELLDAYMQIPAMPLSITLDRDGRERRVWNPSFAKAGLEPLEEDDFLNWDDFCGNADVTAEVFRDDLGPWKPLDG